MENFVDLIFVYNSLLGNDMAIDCKTEIYKSQCE